jgi:hypothetical protein
LIFVQLFGIVAILSEGIVRYNQHFTTPLARSGLNLGEKFVRSEIVNSNLLDLYHRYVVFAFDQQMALADWMESNTTGGRYDYTTSKATLDLGGPQPLLAFELGSYSAKDNSWLWAWCNSTRVLVPENVELGEAVQQLGETLNIDCFLASEKFDCTAEIGEELHEIAPYVFAWTIGSELMFNASYVMPYPHGQFVVLIKDDEIPERNNTTLPSIRSSFLQVVSAVAIPNHRAAFEGYLGQLKIDFEQDETSIRLEDEGSQMTASFDDLGRLQSMDGNI